MSLVAKDKPVRVLEVGSWIGFSALTWADAVASFSTTGGEIVCVDPWRPYFSGSDLSKTDARYDRMDKLLRSGLAFDLFQHNIACAPQKRLFATIVATPENFCRLSSHLASTSYISMGATITQR